MADEQANVTVGLLGPVEVRGPDGRIPVAGTKLQGLVALLALAVPHPVSDDRLIESLWGEQLPANPANALQAQVSQLRRVVGRDVVVRQGAGYRLAVAPDAVDATLLAHLVARAAVATEAGDHRGAAQHLRRAAGLQRGPVLGDLLDLEPLAVAATRLTEELLGVDEALADAELASGRHAEIVGPLTELVRAHPLRERLAAQLIVALYRCGRQVDALQAYGQVRDALIEEFGVEPSAELKALEGAVLAQDPALAAPVPATGPVPPADLWSARASSGRLPLVGRDAELEVLRADLADVLQGRGRVAVLVGEPGIGKTRLAEELADDAVAAGATTGWGRCHDGQGDVAFRAWSQIVATLAERSDPAEVVGALGHGGTDLARIVPELRDLGVDVAGAAPADPEVAEARVADALVAFLRGLARVRPLVVALDDIQWADPSSLRVLAVVVREIADARILVVATYRSVGAPAHAQLADVLSVVVRQPVARRFDLGGLGRDALGALVEASGGSRTDDEVAAIHRRTQGNPFFAVEVLRLAADGDRGRDALAVPAGVRDVVRQRLRTLPDATNEVLGAASILGLEIDVATVALALGTDAAEVLDRLEPAMASGLVLAGDGPFELRFSHGLVNETVHGDLAVVTKLRGHLRAADALAARHGAGGGPHLADIAAHRCRAVPVGATDDAMEACIRAATWLVAHLAHEQAEELLGRALGLVEALPAGRERDAAELELLDRLWLLRMMTKGYGTPGAAAAVGRMGELCEAIGDPEVIAPVVWRLVNYLCVAAVFDEAHRLSTRLLRAASEDPRVAHSAHLAMAITLTHLGEVAEARPHFEAVADGPLEPDGGVEAAYDAWNRFLGGDEAVADEVVAEAADAFGPEAYPSAVTGWFATLVATLRRDPDEVLVRGERWIAAARAQGMGVFVPYMLVCRGWAVAVREDVDLGLAEMQTAAEDIEATGARMLRNLFHGLQADALLAADRPRDALRAADIALEYVERYGERWFEAEIHRLRGLAILGLDPEDPAGRDALERSVAVATGQGSATYARRARAALAELDGQEPAVRSPAP